MKLLTNLIFEPKGKHDPSAVYNIKDTVMSADGSQVYFALQDVPVGIALDNEEYWMLQIDLSESKHALDQAAAQANRPGQYVNGEVAKASGNPISFLPDAGSLLKPVTVLTPKQEGEGDPSLDNIRPIVGWDALELRHAGKNILPWPYPDGDVRIHNGITFTVNKDGSVTLDGESGDQGGYYRLYNNAKLGGGFVSGDTYSATNGVFVGSGRARYTVGGAVSINSGANAKFENKIYYPQVEVGTVATEYTPPVGVNVYNAQLGETVYGGRYDWLTGKLVIEWYGEEVQNLTDQYYNEAGGFVAGKLQRVVYGEYNAVQPESVVCSHYVSGSQAKVVVGGSTNSMFRVYNSGFTSLNDWQTYLAAQKAAGTPVQVVYRLAEPIEIQFTPAIITAVEPEQNNTLYGDGVIEVEYIKPLLESIKEHGGGGGQSPGIPANITINGEGPDENGNFVINTLNDVEIAQLSAVLT